MKPRFDGIGQCVIQPRGAASIVDYVDLFKSDLMLEDMNQYAWDIFNLSSQKNELLRACDWAEHAIKVSEDSYLKANYIDTYANILYKLNEKELAIDAENKALSMIKSTTNPISDDFRKDKIKEYNETIHKMLTGAPTWPVFDQKPAIDVSACHRFTETLNESISNDGNYILYIIPEESGETKLVIKSSNSKTVKEIVANSFSSPQFIKDSRRIVFRKSGDSLCIVNFKTDENIYVSDCISFKISENGEWLAYQLKPRELVVLNLFSEKKANIFKCHRLYIFT